MAVTVLPTGAVTLRGPTGTGEPAHPESFVVGDPPQWADGSDATYSEQHLADEGVAPIDPFAPVGQVLGVSLDIRFSVAGSIPEGTGLGPYLFPTDGPGVGVPSAVDFEFPLVTSSGGAIQTLHVVPDPMFSTVEDAAAVLAVGASLALYAADPDATLTVYGVTLTVTTTDVAPVEEPVTRLWPRKDNRGPMGSGDILYPYPGGGRLVGGYN